MKYLTYILLMTLSLSVNGKPYEIMGNMPTVAKIYHKILVANKVYSYPTLVRYKWSLNCGIACYSQGIIYLSDRFLDLKPNKHELALVLGHELAHFLGAVGQGKASETLADKWGAKLMQKAGYNKCKGAQLYKIFMPDDKHPLPLDRVKALGCK